MGAFGYFPTYALGNVYAAQIFEALQNEFPDLKAKIASGHLLFIREWLKDHLHKYGRQYTPQEMIVKISGKELSEQPYVDYLKQKFSKIYNF